MKSRRNFILSLGLGSSTLFSAKALADPGDRIRKLRENATKLKETERDAKLLGYKEDATKVDPKKFTKYKTGQSCANCFLGNKTKGDKTKGNKDLLCTATYRKVAPTAWCKLYRSREEFDKFFKRDADKK